MNDQPKSALFANFTEATGEEYGALVAGYLMAETPLRRADAVMIFGNRNIVAQSAWQASRLYNEGLATKIIASGGVKVEGGRTEARAIADELLRYGVPRQNILLEEKSGNTLENVLFTRHTIGGREKIDSVIAVGHVAASRRFLMTLHHNWPEALPMVAGVNPYPVQPAQWQRHDRFAATVEKELNKLPLYLDRGHIREIDLPDLHQRLSALPDATQPPQRSLHL